MISNVKYQSNLENPQASYSNLFQPAFQYNPFCTISNLDLDVQVIGRSFLKLSQL